MWCIRVGRGKCVISSSTMENFSGSHCVSHLQRLTSYVNRNSNITEGLKRMPGCRHGYQTTYSARLSYNIGLIVPTERVLIVTNLQSSFMNLAANPTWSFVQNPSNITHKNHITSAVSKTHISRRRCDFYDLHKEVVPYAEAWSWQKAIVGERRALSERNEDFSDSLIILQHHPVYTLGAASSQHFLNFDVNNAPFDLYRTERGGEVTYHGPGQLVMYPIINLRYYKMDLHWYLRSLEEVVIRALSSTFAINASRVEGLTGVWVGNQKLAAIGIKVSQWITCHGLALNVTTDITPFQQIVPCGIRDRQVGSVKGLVNEYFRFEGCREEDNHHSDDDILIYATYKSLVREFCDIFQVDLCHKPVDLWRRTFDVAS